MLPTPTDFARSLHARTTSLRHASDKSSRSFNLAVRSDPQLLTKRRPYEPEQPCSTDLAAFPYGRQTVRIGDGKETSRLKTEEEKKFLEKSRLLDPSLEELTEYELEELLLQTEEELQIMESKAQELEPHRMKLLKKLDARISEKVTLQQRLHDVEQRKPHPELENVTASYRELYLSYVMAVRRNTDLTLTLDDIEKAKQKHRQQTPRHTPVTPTVHQFIQTIQSKLGSHNAREPDGDLSAGSSEEMHQETDADIHNMRPPSRALPISLPKAGLVPVYPQSSNNVYNRVPPLKLAKSGVHGEVPMHIAVPNPSKQSTPQDRHDKSQLTFRLNKAKDPLGSRARLILPVIPTRTSHTAADYRDSSSDNDF